jgi:hypothetical protein
VFPPGGILPAYRLLSSDPHCTKSRSVRRGTASRCGTSDGTPGPLGHRPPSGRCHWPSADERTGSAPRHRRHRLVLDRGRRPRRDRRRCPRRMPSAVASRLVRDMPHRLRASLRDRAAQPFEWKFTRGDLAELLERIAQHKPLPNAACISVRNLPARALSAVAHVMLNASDRRGRQKRRQRLRRWVRYVL